METGEEKMLVSDNFMNKLVQKRVLVGGETRRDTLKSRSFSYCGNLFLNPKPSFGGLKMVLLMLVFDDVKRLRTGTE